MGTHVSRVESICEEFSDWILYDSRNKSIILNVAEEHFLTLKRELAKYGFTVVHQTVITMEKSDDTITCVFLHMK